jgi:hypothetical protein
LALVRTRNERGEDFPLQILKIFRIEGKSRRREEGMVFAGPDKGEFYEGAEVSA